MTATQIAFAAAVIFIAFAVRSISGFGAGLIAVPLLAFAFPMHTAVPAFAALNVISSLILGVKDRSHVIWREVWVLAFPTLLGVLVGLYLFRELDQQLLVKLFAGFVIGYAAYTLLAERLQLRSKKCSAFWAVPAGAAGGVVDTLFGGGGGPFVVIYMHLRALGMAGFRATLSIIWVMDSGFRTLGYAASGFYDATAMLMFAAALPLMLAGMYLGERIHSRISPQTFTRILSVLLFTSGIALLLK